MKSGLVNYIKKIAKINDDNIKTAVYLSNGRTSLSTIITCMVLNDNEYDKYYAFDRAVEMVEIGNYNTAAKYVVEKLKDYEISILAKPLVSLIVNKSDLSKDNIKEEAKMIGIKCRGDYTCP